jgi:hypothetical protein
MGGFKLPWRLSGALLASTYLHSICVTAGPSINVGLQTSFPSAPYLLELLYVGALLECLSGNTNSYVEKQQQLKMFPHTFLFLTELQMAIFQKLLQIKTYMINLYKFSKKMDI